MVTQPKLKGKKGKMSFELFSGARTKQFYRAGKFDEINGVYPIFNEKGEVVEYMDILGNFSSKPTEFAVDFYRYLIFERFSPVVARLSGMVFYNCALNGLPSKYLVDEEVKNIVKQEEKDKYEKLCSQKVFVNFIERIIYKKMANRCLKLKLKKAKKLANQLENDINLEPQI